EPRIGLSWDILGTHKTVLKAHYGRFMENVKAYYISSLEPSSDEEWYLVPEWGTLIPWYTTPGEDLYSIDPNIKHPDMHQITAGVEQVIGQDITLGVSLIWRKWGNFIESVNTGGMYNVGSYTDPKTGNSMTIYDQTNLGGDHFLITNPKEGVDYGQAFDDIVWVEPNRRYTAVEFSFTKRMSNNWQLYLSYVYADEAGTYSNSSTWQQSFGMGLASTYQDPNNQTNIDGRSDVNIPHILKVQGTYIFPLDFIFSAYYTLHSGVRWARSTFVPVAQGPLEVLAEPSGTRNQDTVNNLDIRLEKSFNINQFRLRFWADIFNVFNQGYGDYIYATDGTSFGLPLYVSNPRTVRAGLRFQF
ncbi:MAG: TonB-dependent receptor, partial [Candidatus Aminicenantes bacterium]|nr:TonB-dependent receptor [Candidatus Aminicenantes bacterium]